MRRREFITFLGGGGAIVWPIIAGAQQTDRMRQVGMLLPGTADDAVFQTWVGAFLQGLAQSGWVIGRNVRTRRAGRDLKPMTFVGTRRNWPHSRQT